MKNYAFLSMANVVRIKNWSVIILRSAWPGSQWHSVHAFMLCLA